MSSPLLTNNNTKSNIYNSFNTDDMKTLEMEDSLTYAAGVVAAASATDEQVTSNDLVRVFGSGVGPKSRGENLFSGANPSKKRSLVTGPIEISGQDTQFNRDNRRHRVASRVHRGPLHKSVPIGAFDKPAGWYEHDGWSEPTEPASGTRSDGFTVIARRKRNKAKLANQRRSASFSGFSQSSGQSLPTPLPVVSKSAAASPVGSGRGEVWQRGRPAPVGTDTSAFPALRTLLKRSTSNNDVESGYDERPESSSCPSSPDSAATTARELADTSPIVKLVGATPSMIDNCDNRDLAVEFVTWDFPYLGFAGLWNNSFLASTHNHADHFGVHIKDGAVCSVSLPKGFVEELEAYLVHKVHDSKMAAYSLCQIKAVNLAKRLRITPEQLRTCLLYGPAIAYYRRWAEIQNVSRVVTQDHFEWRNSYSWIASAVIGVPVATIISRIAGPSHKYWKLAYSALAVALVHGIMPSSGSLLSRVPMRSCSVTTSYTENARPVNYAQRPESSLSLTSPGRSNPKREPLDNQVRERIEQVGPTNPEYIPRCFENNLQNQVESVKARVLRLTDVPDSNFLASYCEFFKRNADLLFGRPFKLQRFKFEEWLANANSSPSVKVALQRAYDTMLTDGLAPDDCNMPLHPVVVRRWTIRRAFVKEEFTNHRTPEGCVEKAPRLIQGACPEFIVVVGPFISALQGLIKRRWSVDNWATFVCGVSAKAVAANLKLENRRLFEDDMGKYDACFSPEILQLEAWLAVRFGATRSVADLLHANTDTRGYTNGGVKYSRPGGRHSGDPHTSLGNSIHNAVMHLFCYCVSKNLRAEEAIAELKMAVSGDDNIGTHPGEAVDWAPLMAKLGFEAVPKYSLTPTGAEFCSTRLVQTSVGWTFVPKIGRVINKVSYCFDRPSKISIPSLIRGTVMSIYSQAKCLPPLKTWMDHILMLTTGVAAAPVKAEPWKFTNGDNGDATEETWAYLESHYHWDKMKQMEWEDFISTINYVAKPISHPLLTLLLEADTDGPSTLFSSSLSADSYSEPADSEPVANKAAGLNFGELDPDDFLSDAELQNRLGSMRAGNINSLLEPSCLLVGGVKPRGGKVKNSKNRSVQQPRRSATSQPNIHRVKEKRESKSSSSGGSLGSRIGGGLGSFLGNAAQKAFTTITGMGDYSVTQNSLYTGSSRNSQPPSFAANTAQGTVRINHKEYVKDISSIGSAFNMSNFTINPTNPLLFPWLSSLAPNWEQYKIHGMVFFFNTNSATSVASTNTALGSVIMTTQYNVNESLFTGKLQMEQYQYSVSTVPSASCMHPIECKPSLGTLDVLYTVPDNATEDARFSDFGRFSIATVGQQAASNIGELWCVYDIEFIKPRLFLDVTSIAPTFLYHNAFQSKPTNISTDVNAFRTDVFKNSPVSSPYLGAGMYVHPTSTLGLKYGTLATGDANLIYIAGSVTGVFMFKIFVIYTSPYLTNTEYTKTGAFYFDYPNSGGYVTNGLNIIDTLGNNATANRPLWDLNTKLVRPGLSEACVWDGFTQFIEFQDTPQDKVIRLNYPTYTSSAGGALQVRSFQLMMVPFNVRTQ